MSKMDHQEAIKMNATERYLLGELAGELRDQFEAHYFDCADCARDVVAGATFVDAARELLVTDAVPQLAPQRPKAQPRRWFDFLLRPAFSAPAMALLLLVTVIQAAVVIPHLRATIAEAMQPRVLSWYSVAAQNSRGGEAQTIQVSAKGSFGLFLDIPPEKHFPAYTCDFETESGSPEFSLPVSAAQAATTLQLLIPSSRLGPGKHLLVVRGAESSTASSASSTEVARYEFTLDLSK